MNNVNRELLKKLWMLVHARQSIQLAYDQCIKPLNLSDGVYRLYPTKEDWIVPTKATPGVFEITRGADPTTGEC